VLPYRWAISVPNPDGVSSANTQEKREEAMRELEKVRKLHPIELSDPATHVTVGIPVKDMAKYVLHAMKSVLDQTHADWNLLVVDDGSSDATARLVEGFIAAHPERDIELFKFPENLGDRAACNFMLAKAKGEYYVSLSADDLIEAEYLERCVEFFKNNAHLEFVASQTGFIAEDGSPHTAEHPAKLIERASNKTREEWKSSLYFGNSYFGAGMFRTKTLRDLGGWKPEYGCLSDYEMYLAMLVRGDIHIIEENLTQTRIHASNMSMNLDPVWLRETYAAIRKRYYPPRRKLLIATPFYETRGFSPYIGSMARTVAMLTRAGFAFEYMLPSGDAYVHRVKNTILNTFLEDKEATDLLMIDSDMEWPAEALLAMLMCPEEIIVGSYPMKNNWGAWTSKPAFSKDEADGKFYATERKLPNGGLLIKGQDMAGGFMLMKRPPLEKFKAAYPELRYLDPSADTKAPERVYTEFFTAGTLKKPGEEIGTFWGEDRYFSYRLREIGVDWWIFADIEFGHWGVGGWHGNFKKHLDLCKDGPSPESQTANAPRPQ
jgi:glycosyltransferase involved in cell wall biosynthesis